MKTATNLIALEGRRRTERHKDKVWATMATESKDCPKCGTRIHVDETCPKCAIKPFAAPSSSGFDAWWHNEGSGMPSLPGEDSETHVHRVCKIAWENGAYKALECPQCGGTGGVDSGGVTPWGSGIDIPCPSCSSNAKLIDPAK